MTQTDQFSLLVNNMSALAQHCVESHASGAWQAWVSPDGYIEYFDSIDAAMAKSDFAANQCHKLYSASTECDMLDYLDQHYCNLSPFEVWTLSGVPIHD